MIFTMVIFQGNRASEAVFASEARQSMSEFSTVLRSDIRSWIAAGACAPAQ